MVIIWPLRTKLVQPIFNQQRPKFTGGRRIPLLPGRPWEFKDRPQLGVASFYRYDLPPTFKYFNGYPFARPSARSSARPSVVHRLFPTTPARFYLISGVTRDSVGAALPVCTVELFESATDVIVDRQISDASGAFTFKSPQLGKTYYLVAYKAGSPDVAGTTVNTLAGVMP